ncbi:MAG: hypothetical protein M0036_05680 [Desulfobacteraceae bacterium]|nr:hypothetical protein [Desulfobacteraceae bacterium]
MDNKAIADSVSGSNSGPVAIELQGQIIIKAAIKARRCGRFGNPHGKQLAPSRARINTGNQFAPPGGLFVAAKGDLERSLWNFDNILGNSHRDGVPPEKNSQITRRNIDLSNRLNK